MSAARLALQASSKCNPGTSARKSRWAAPKTRTPSAKRAAKAARSIRSGLAGCKLLLIGMEGVSRAHAEAPLDFFIGDASAQPFEDAKMPERFRHHLGQRPARLGGAEHHLDPARAHARGGHAMAVIAGEKEFALVHLLPGLEPAEQRERNLQRAPPFS